MREHAINQKDLFINGYYIDDDALMQDLVDYHKNSDRKGKGRVGADGYLDVTRKDSTDVVIDPRDDIYVRYCLHLAEILKKVREKYPSIDDAPEWTVRQSIQIQHYAPKGAYHAWHWERSGETQDVIKRVLVFMTYLNDVQVGGETMFMYQNVKIKPERGLTLFWPTDWTHTHKGIPAPYEDKYITTGWYSFVW